MNCCKYADCERPVSAKSYCSLHYGWLLKDWLDPETNQRTAACRGHHDAKACIVKTCCGVSDLRQGFCPKHYKQLRRGVIDAEGNSLRPIRGRYKPSDVCKVPDCKKRPRRSGFCKAHSTAYYAGRLDDQGLASNKYEKKRRTYPRDWACVGCSVKGTKYILGFCKPCYSRFKKGILSFDGVVLRKRKKASYKPDSRCMIPGCDQRPRCRGYCASHALMLKNGTITKTGVRLYVPHVNKGRSCTLCAEPAYAKGFCTLHYSRKKHTGVAYLNKEDNPNWKNVGKTCSEEGCSKPARVRTLCSAHYSALRRAGTL